MSTFSQKSRIAFGRGAEYYIFSKMMFEGLNVYPSLVDDHGIDALVECPDGRICKVQVKAVSSDARDAKRPLFAAIEHPFIAIDDYWFVFLCRGRGQDMDYDIKRVPWRVFKE